MRKGIPVRVRKRQWALIVVIALVLTGIMTSGIQLFTARQTGPPSAGEQKQFTTIDVPSPQQELVAVPQADRSNTPSSASRFIQEEQEAGKIAKLPVGSVSIVNTDGVTVAEFSAAVVGGSWLALPTRACVGGNKWFFKVGNEAPIPIEGGLWGRGDAVGFWQLAGERKFQGLDFATWQQEIPVKLLSMKTGILSDPILLTPAGVQGAFIYSSLPDSLEPGVFVQNGKAVGWSFGDILDGAYMWTLGKDTNLLYENYVDDFYIETFAGGREELFSIALSKGGNSSVQRQLQMFAEAFWVQPKLSPKDTPRFLSPETVHPYIAKLVNFIMAQGAFEYIALLAEEPMLREIGDAGLLMNVILATQKIYGTERAINFIEGPGADIQRAMEGEAVELTELHRKLYLGWIKNLLDNGDIARGWQVYNRAQPRFSDSPELHLLAVELALAGGDWAEAESLLYQREYPTALREKRMLLTGRISDLKGQENKLVISFAPGSREIQVKTTLNERLDHDFLIDTGASFVTIPYATVQALGLEDEMSQHQLEVQTAGGPVSANAITLSSIELQGWAVSDVKALVIDLPNRPGLGLLGLNFLNSFRVDLQAEEGLLILEPK